MARSFESFPGVPVMVLTATLSEEHLNLLCKNYLRIPVLIKSTVDRPNIQLNVGKYQAKRPVKGDKSLVWLDTAKQISNLLADEYGKVYMDFKKDVELMVNCLKKVVHLMQERTTGAFPVKKRWRSIAYLETKIFNCLWLQSRMKSELTVRTCKV